VLFPDPWPKRRHTGRRLVDERFVADVADLLPTGGTLHVATDWDDYAHQIRAALAAEPRFDIEIAGGEGDGAGGARWVPAAELAGTLGAVGTEDPPTWRSPRPDRPVTAYERRGLHAGRTVTDLVARRR
jgi:tRNA (guanine-N7-)-methyltransferase